MLGCFSRGTASELGNVIIPPYMALERLHMKNRAQSRATQSKTTGPSSVESHQGGWQLEDMAYEERELGWLCLQKTKPRGGLTTFQCLRRSYREGKPNPSQKHKVKCNNKLHPGKFGLGVKKSFPLQQKCLSPGAKKVCRNSTTGDFKA